MALTKEDVARAGFGPIIAKDPANATARPTSVNWRGTWAMYVEEGSYELAHDGSSVESGTFVLQKPDVVVFTAESGVCPSLSAQPTTYDWSSAATGITWDLAKGGGCAGPQPLTQRSWSRAPRGQIVFGTGGDIFTADATADAAGLHRQQITQVNFDAKVFDIQPVWSPDGSKIAFHSDSGDNDLRPSSLALVNADGSGLTTLVARKGFVGRPAWSPDGTKIALLIDSAIFVVDADGSNLTQLFKEKAVPPVLDAPVWTPDGDRIVFWESTSRSGALLSMRPDGTDVHDLFDALPSRAKNFVPDFTPGGRWIVVSDAWYVGQADIFDHPVYLISADGSQVFQIVTYGAEPKWRPGTT